MHGEDMKTAISNLQTARKYCPQHGEIGDARGHFGSGYSLTAKDSQKLLLLRLGPVATET